MLKRALRHAELLARRVGRAQVEEAAACARALTALVGRAPDGVPFPGGPAQATRAMLTDRVLRGRDPVPWPSGLMRQLDPGDPAFLAPMGLHPVLAARDRILISLPGGEGQSPAAWVDPLGWCGVGEGPSVAVWFGLEDAAWPVGRRPDESGEQAVAAGNSVRQEWSDERVGVRTICRRGDLTLTLMHWPVRLGRDVAFALYTKLELAGTRPRAARLALAIRPATLEGVSPIFHLSRDGDGLWSADGVPILALSRVGDGLLTGRWGQQDAWHRFAQSGAGDLTRLGRAELRCPAGQATAAEVWTPTLTPGEAWSRLAVVAPPAGTPAALVRTSGPSLWSGASADRRGLLQAGCEILLDAHQMPFDAARLRLLQDPSEADVPALLGTVALARLGFVRRAEDRLGDWLGAVRRDGRLGGASGGETEAVLAWAAGEVVRWTGNRAWARHHLAPWKRLLDRLASDAEDEPGGHILLGREGSSRWSATWRAAGLLSSAAALREHAPEHTHWAIAGGRRREQLPERLGPAPWSVAEGRATDGAAAGMMAACWLGLLRADHPDAVVTAAHLRERHWHGGGVFHQGGAHPAATALLLAVAGRLDPQVDAVGTLAALASPVGALPTARHPTRGALGDGDDLLSAALFVLVVLDRIQVERGRIRVRPGIRLARDLPTPHGRIDIDRSADGAWQVVGRWRGPAPAVEVGEVGEAGADSTGS